MLLVELRLVGIVYKRKPHECEVVGLPRGVVNVLVKRQDHADCETDDAAEDCDFCKAVEI